jgi:hypothetical protein
MMQGKKGTKGELCDHPAAYIDKRIDADEGLWQDMLPLYDGKEYGAGDGALEPPRGRGSVGYMGKWYTLWHR